MSSSPTPSRLSLAPSRQASQDGPPSPSPLVALALSLKIFATKETRRDLTVSKRAFEGAWNGLERCAVLSQSCRRLGERAAAVLLGVHGALESLEQQEQGQQPAKGYEFDGSKAGSSTKIKLQSTLTDLQAFATDFSSNKDRQQLLVHGIEPTLRLIASLHASLASTIALYSISVDTSLWVDENALDLGQDKMALPRLFQHAIAPRGPTYDSFVKARPPSPGDTSKRRDEFIEWCFEQQPLLRPDPESPLSPRRKWTAPTSPGLGPSSPSLDLEAHRRGLAASPSPPGVPQRRRASEGPTGVPSADMRRTASTSSSSTSALGVGLAPGGSEMLRRASAPEAAATPTSTLDHSTSSPSPTPTTLDETSSKEAVEDEELMEGISRQGRRPSDDRSFASSEMSPSSSVDSRMFATAQVTVVGNPGVAVVPEEAPAAAVEEREEQKQEAKVEEEVLEPTVEKEKIPVSLPPCDRCEDKR
ncbi:hypothetical protein BCR35DRAFT_312143 [Leucosporidium creatinivorum]|uniref:Uncharacterized protein n=1 Tax=Leucosporidium creatinivorum TaxID=106004 RepID=A0A1Y2G1M1_9BASI|nr:hypothetical protein BCR35DRAFT_312143 [Leucosporidium creatinivorum]